MSRKKNLTTKKPKLIVILGQTASGKSDLAIKLAKKFKGEIVSADSRQVFKEMDIGTAKPIKIQKSKVKGQKSIIIDGIFHHLIDVVYPNEEFNVAIYKKLALKAIKDIQKRKKIPFLVGGTGLYLQAIVDNLEFPKVKPLRALRKKLEKKTAKELFEIYQKLDPEGVKFIDKKNKRRLIRAIEVCKKTKIPFWQQRKKGKPLFEVLQIGKKIEKEKLKKNIKMRVNKMIKMGLEKEVKNLVKKYGWTLPLQTIGYQEWKDYFEGKIDKKEVERLICQHTLQFAKRQMSWFKRDKRIKWIKSYREAERLIRDFIDDKM
jgi:tRNA dimethylallyltransferase